MEGETYLSEIPAQTFSTISVYLTISDVKKIIKVPSNSLIKFLRKRIMEEFDLKTVDFDMYLFRNEKPITPEQEEDYSTIAIGFFLNFYLFSYKLFKKIKLIM